MPVPEHSGALLHRVPGRYRRTPRGCAYGFFGVVRGFLDGQWYTFDARHNFPRIGRVLIARGRDAADVAISMTFGVCSLQSFRVWTDEVKSLAA